MVVSSNSLSITTPHCLNFQTYSQVSEKLKTATTKQQKQPVEYEESRKSCGTAQQPSSKSKMFYSILSYHQEHSYHSDDVLSPIPRYLLQERKKEPRGENARYCIYACYLTLDNQDAAPKWSEWAMHKLNEAFSFNVHEEI